MTGKMRPPEPADEIDLVPLTVGRRVRNARIARGWTLDQLAERSGVSRRMIVNVESGSNASLTTLLRLAQSLHVSLADLVADGPAGEPVLVSAATSRTPLWTGPQGGTGTLLTAADTPDMLELWEWHLEPGEEYASEAHLPGTQELLHLRSGSLDLTVGDVTHTLRTGDAVSFAADVPHSYAASGTRTARFSMAVLEPIARSRS